MFLLSSENILPSNIYRNFKVNVNVKKSMKTFNETLGTKTMNKIKSQKKKLTIHTARCFVRIINNKGLVKTNGIK